MTRLEAEQAYLDEFAANSADLMRRALAYAANKRADEYRRAMAVVAPEEKYNGKKVRKARQKPTIVVTPRRKVEPEHKEPTVFNKGREAKRYTYDGVEDTLLGWANRYGLMPYNIQNRLNSDKPFDRALEEAIEAKKTGRGIGRPPKKR